MATAKRNRSAHGIAPVPAGDTPVQPRSEHVDATPADRPGHPDRLTNLSCALRTRFSRTGMPVDLDRAVETAQRAVTLSAADDFGFAISVLNRRTGLTRWPQSLYEYQPRPPATFCRLETPVPDKSVGKM